MAYTLRNNDGVLNRNSVDISVV